MKPLCIYHGNCADGFTAAWIVWKALGPDQVEFFAGAYQDEPPAARGRDLILVDFSYKRPAMEKLAKQALSLVLLDHHQSAIDDLDGLLTDLPLDLSYAGLVAQRLKAARFSLNRSGAGLAWEFFHPGQPAPRLVQYVEDRDLWRFQLPKSRAVNANILSHATSFAAWEQLYWDLADGAKLQRFMAGGEAIERKHQKDVAELVKVMRRRMKIGGHDVPAANLPYTLSSDAGHLMAADKSNGGEKFAACYWDIAGSSPGTGYRVFSLRSAEDGLDVAAIAQQYGGGGHKHAAGFRVPLGKLGELA